MSMNVTRRFLELRERKQFLNRTIEQWEKEKNNSITMMLSKAFDEKAEEKIAAEIVFLENWRDEVIREMKELEEKVKERIWDGDGVLGV